MGFKVISMFSGAGGLDMGFHNKGFRILWANDFAKDACDTYDKWANYNEDGTRKKEEECTIIECGDITKLDLTTVLPGIEVDVILGGFPCQGFSLAGPRQVDDSRNILYRHFVEMVRIKNPKVIVAENVIGIKTLGDGAVFDKIIEDFSELGYTMSAPTVNAKNFGVPQDRMRVIFIGISWYIIDKTIHKYKNIKNIDLYNKHKGFNSNNEILDFDINTLYNSKIRNILYKVCSNTLNIKFQHRNKYNVIGTLMLSFGGGSNRKTMWNTSGQLSVISELKLEEFNRLVLYSNNFKCYFSSTNENECKSFISYCNTRLIRFMVLIGVCGDSITNSETWRFVPAPDAFDHIFTDKELYEKYNLTEEEINIIESVIKERK